MPGGTQGANVSRVVGMDTIRNEDGLHQPKRDGGRGVAGWAENRKRSVHSMRSRIPACGSSMERHALTQSRAPSMDLSQLRIVDLSVPLEHLAASEPLPAKIHYVRHAEEGLAQMQQFFGVAPADLVYSNGQGWAVEEIQAITHTGTHVDAPYHYGATSEGKPARTIDLVPLEWCFAPGVILDMRHKAAGETISADDLAGALGQINYTLKPLDIVLLQTGADARLGSAEYFRQPGLGREGVLWLVAEGGGGGAL